LQEKVKEQQEKVGVKGLSYNLLYAISFD
jgi:hypothetical protein